jgi:hypothetical protein
MGFNFAANLRSESIPAGSLNSSFPSRFDTMLDKAVARSMRHPLEPEIIHERVRPRTFFRLAAGFAIAFALFAIAAILLFILVPNLSKGSSTEPAVSEYRAMASWAAANTTPEESQALLQKFLQWRDRK